MPALPEGFSFMYSGKSQQGEQNSLESQVAVGAVEPFTQGMGPTAISSRADCGGLNAQGEGNVSVSGGEAGKRLET